MKVLAVIDMQKDFIDGALGTPEAQAIVPAVQARIAQARADGERVVFTRDTHHENYLQTQEGRKLPVPCSTSTAACSRSRTASSLSSPCKAMFCTTYSGVAPDLVLLA